MRNLDELRALIEAALGESIDRCARCKVCDVQVNAVMSVLAGIPEQGAECEPDGEGGIGHDTIREQTGPDA